MYVQWLAGYARIYSPVVKNGRGTYTEHPVYALEWDEVAGAWLWREPPMLAA